MIAQYAISQPDFVLSHWKSFALIRDGLEERRRKLDVLVRSGDYFITLATAIDHLSKQQKDASTREELQIIVSELLYLHVYYSIVKGKNPSRRLP